MSKENNNLRLLGSPVNLSYRNKKKEDRKSIRNRPRSALQNSCKSPDIPERYKRPFSADAKERAPSTRNLLKTFSAELLDSYNNSPPVTTIKIFPPTTELLGDRKPPENLPHLREICSNASDYGSEDTFISLGTKIKAKAQTSPKPKNTNTKNYLKYRNIAKKGRKSMENTINENAHTQPNEYGMEVKITEKKSPIRSPSPSKNKNMFDERSFSPTLKTRPYESYFIPLEGERKETEEELLGRVSFGIHAEVEQAIDKYSRRLTLTKQQLSLVEEESTQDLDSVPSQNSLSPEISLEEVKKVDNVNELYRNTHEAKTDYPQISRNFICDPRTYTSFYDDFRTDAVDTFKTKLSSTVNHTDSSSKDSGYPDSGPNDDKYKQNYSLPSTSLVKRSSSHNNMDEQPKSLDSASTSSNRQGYHQSFPLDRKDQWAEPLNQSRMLYKDFFLKKEGHIALPPNNSPTRSKEKFPTEETDKNEPELDYPQYLVNSTTKAYTSKVIEDYKKELEAINNLHELTLKDIQTDAVSPTPLNIDKMFEDAASVDKRDSEMSPESLTPEKVNNKVYDIKQRQEISKISTKELIQNYLKVKEGDAKDVVIKTLQKFDKKVNNVNPKFENIASRYKQDWNNKTKPSISKSSSNSQINGRNQTQKNVFTMRAPLSARIEGVHNDKDIDSWISINAPSPVEDKKQVSNEPIQIEPVQNDPNYAEHKVETREIRQLVTPRTSAEKETVKPSELNTNSSVLDIYSMLKEIESYGENPVTPVATVNIDDEEVKKEENKTPKDNFMEIFEFLEKVEQSANEALSVVTSTTPQTIPKLEALLKLPQTELAQRLVTATLQLEERSCCIALLQESLTNHKEQMISKVGNLEKQSTRNVSKVKQECEDTIKRHQSFIDQLINDKKTLNHRIEQLVDERRSLEDRWKRSAQALEERYKLELRNQHDKMAAAQQVARQRWVRQKAEKIKELTVKGLEGELREMAERQQKEISDLKMSHAEQLGRSQARHSQEVEELRRCLQDEKEVALVKERQMAASRLEKQILELELTYQEQRTRLVAEMRAENERVASGLGERERSMREEMDKWRQEQEILIAEKRAQLENEMAAERKKVEEILKLKQGELESHFAQHRQNFEAEQQMLLKKRVTEIAAQHKIERDKEIEKAIETMDAEAQAGRKELQEAIRRNKAQYEAELKELAETEQATLRRYQEAQARVRQTEDKCAELEMSANQLETRNRVLTEKNIQMEARAEEVRASCEEAWHGKIEALRKEMEDTRRTHEEQMHQLYAKVKVAVARKDSAIQGLTREAAKYQEKIITLEQKLQQQRKDFLRQK